MQRTSLRPVPRRPAAPVDPVDAGRAVARALPGLDPAARDALALIALAGRTRSEAAARLETEPVEFAGALARARKELRRQVQPLRASGWCERAELLISDRLDDALGERDAARLEVHLRNCERCVEHERRLVQATDALVASVAGEPIVGPAEPAAPLALVSAKGSVVGRTPIAAVPFGEPVALAPREEADLPSPLASAAAWYALLVFGLLLSLACAALALAVD